MYGRKLIHGDETSIPMYKANRKEKARDNDDMDWTLIFDTLHKVKMEIKENFPYR